MRTTRAKRLELARLIRAQLPWAHIVVGAKGHNFIEVSRGECIKGSYSTGKKLGHIGSAWSRAWPGSYALHIDLGGEWAEVRRHMEPRYNETERMIVSKRVELPERMARVRWAAFAETLAGFIVHYAVVCIPEAIRARSLLRKHERFVVEVNDLGVGVVK